jgi:eukaryotic-like serine/threonine-protein kinase
MRPERWQAIEELYHSASDLPDKQRNSFLNKACGEDHSLLREVESLLKHGSSSQSVLDTPAIAIMAKAIAADEYQSRVLSLEGKTISHYRILEAIGRGGMGLVYKAEDQKLGRQVALKLLPRFLAGDLEALQRFEREARAASALNHPNICTVYEIDESEDLHLMAMELIEGETLKERIARGPLEIPALVNIAVEICSALEAAHSVGIIHRDIKPSNILITTQGRTKLLDFGVAKRVGSGSESRADGFKPDATGSFDLRLTNTGVALGTAAYMSPEQTTGQEVDARSDLFSLGAVLYEMATGKHPFPGTDIGEVLRAIRVQSPTPIKQTNSAVPVELIRITTKAMEKDRSQRYQTVRAMRADLQTLGDRLKERVSRKNAVLATALCLLLLVIAGAASWRIPRVREWVSGKPSNLAPVVKSLAVLPLKNLTGDESQEYFVDGMTDALISNLAQIKSLRVISRGSVMGYRNRPKSSAEIAKELNVDVLVAGSVVRSGDSVSVEAQLIAAPNWQPIWTRTYRRRINDLPTLQNDVTQAITSEIQTELTPQERFRVAADKAVNPEAYDLYLRGRYCWNKRTEDGYDKAIQFFQRAIAIQPDYAKAYAGLADSFALGAWKKQGLSRVDTISLARSNALRAIQLDDNLVEAHASLASISYVYDWDWSFAEKEFHRAIELNPNYATAHHWYAYYCFSRNRLDEGMREIRLAQQLDPQSLIIHNDVGQLLYESRRYDEAIEEERRTLEMDESFPWPHLWLGLSYLAKEQNPEALSELETYVRLMGRDPGAMALLGMAYARTDHTAEAQQVLRDIQALPAEQYGSLSEIAFLLASLGQKDEAFAWLERILPDRPRPLKRLHVTPYLDPLRSDPRFQDLQRRIGLP